MKTDPSDHFDLKRFLDAQAPCFPQVLSELSAGKKRSHWMWFIFPQVRGLGSSAMAQRFAIAGLEEAKAYLAHPVLGARLRECTTLVNAVEGCAASDIFSYPDDLKFQSSMTLFATVTEADTTDSIFKDALTRYFRGVPDPATLARL